VNGTSVDVQECVVCPMVTLHLVVILLSCRSCEQLGSVVAHTMVRWYHTHTVHTHIHTVVRWYTHT